MKKWILISVAFLGVQEAFSQLFQPIDSIRVEASNPQSGVWADIDNNEIYDFVFLAFRQGQASGHLLRWPLGATEPDTLNIDSLSGPRFLLADVDNNNRLDVIGMISRGNEEYLSIYYQTDSLHFLSPEIVDPVTVNKIIAVDLDNDGKKELTYTTNDQLVIKTLDAQGAWENYREAVVKSGHSDWLVYDADNDGWRDILLQDENNGTPRTRFLQNDQGELVSIDTTFIDQMRTSLLKADFGGNGQFDIGVLGYSSGNELEVAIYNDSSDITLGSFNDVVSAEGFAADLNADGLADVLISGRYATGSALNYIFYNQGSGQFLPTGSDTLHVPLIDRLADVDYDGDLDRLIASHDQDTLTLTVYDNITPGKNYGPDIVSGHGIFHTTSGTVLAWNVSEDDHTNAASLTYDVFVGLSDSTSENLAGNFDLTHAKRLLAVRGNAGFNEYILLKNLPAADYSYGIQAIDNSLYYIGPPGGGNGDGCKGRAIACGDFTVCDPAIVKGVVACKGDTVTLQHTGTASWYSSGNGFLGTADRIEITAMTADTVFMSIPNDTGCNNRAFAIRLSDSPDPLLLTDTTTCVGAELNFQVASDLNNVSWTSDLRGILSSTYGLVVQAADNEQIIVEAFSGSCAIKDTFNIAISSATLDSSRSVFKILKGQSVVISVAGSGLETYSWTPAEFLNDNGVPNPTSTPPRTTAYSVLATDSLGCEFRKNVLVQVVERGWVPNLFTPNDDGKNDRLLVYGLESIENFHFSIFNRSGVVVYQSDNIGDVTQSGWDGTAKGVDQPNGIYYWKVTGRADDGSNLLLNDKDSGIIYLMR